MDVSIMNNHLPDFSVMSFTATLQLGLLDCHNSTRKCRNKLETLHTIQHGLVSSCCKLLLSVIYSLLLSISLPMKRQGKPKLYSYKC